MLRKFFVALLSAGLLLALALPTLAQDDPITGTDALTQGVEITGIAEVTTGVEVTQVLEITETGDTTDVTVFTETAVVTDSAAATVTETLTDAAADVAETEAATEAATETATDTAIMTSTVDVAAVEALFSDVAAAQVEELPSIVEWLQTGGVGFSFSTLLTALTEAGLVDALQGDGPLIVFAPDDFAFGSLPEGTLETLLADPEGELADILRYHVVARDLTESEADALFAGEPVELETLQGSTLTFRLVGEGEEAVFFVDDIELFAVGDASNGVVFAIDGVLMPPADDGNGNGDDDDNGDDNNGDDDNGTIPDSPDTGAGLPTPLLYLIGALVAALLVVGGLFVRGRAGTKP